MTESQQAYGFTLGESSRTNCPASIFPSRTVYSAEPRRDDHRTELVPADDRRADLGAQLHAVAHE